MKKLFLTSIGLSLVFLINAYAVTTYNFNTKCPQWEHGDVVHYNGVQQNVAGTSPSAYCWDIVQIEGSGLYNDNVYAGELLTMSQSIADWYATLQYTVYGDSYIGSVVRVVIMGLPQNEPRVWISSTQGVLIGEEGITSPSGSILNGKVYTFFLPHLITSKFTGELEQLDIHDYIKVYDGSTLKDTTFIK